MDESGTLKDIPFSGDCLTFPLFYSRMAVPILYIYIYVMLAWAQQRRPCMAEPRTASVEHCHSSGAVCAGPWERAKGRAATHGGSCLVATNLWIYHPAIHQRGLAGKSTVN